LERDAKLLNLSTFGRDVFKRRRDPGAHPADQFFKRLQVREDGRFWLGNRRWLIWCEKSCGRDDQKCRSGNNGRWLEVAGEGKPRRQQQNANAGGGRSKSTGVIWQVWCG
jgi:hypothetical protein